MECRLILCVCFVSSEGGVRGAEGTDGGGLVFSFCCYCWMNYVFDLVLSSELQVFEWGGSFRSSLFFFSRCGTFGTGFLSSISNFAFSNEIMGLVSINT